MASTTTVEAIHHGYKSSPELDVYRASIRAFLSRAAPLTRTRGAMEKPGAGFDREVWTALAQQIGVQGLTVPETFGGSGASWVELGVVFEETGRGLLPGPLLVSVAMATTVLAFAAESETRSHWLNGLSSGDVVGAVAVETCGGEISSVVAESRGDHHVLHGAAGIVLDVDAADFIIVGAVEGSEVRPFLVQRHDDGVSLMSASCFDLTHRIDTLTLDRTRAVRLDETDLGLRMARQLGGLALTCEQVGIAQRVLEITLTHVLARTQFGQALGSFQAVKHRCVDMFLEVEAAILATRAACAAAVDPHSQNAARATSIARVVATNAASFVTEEAIQLHGGIGFTWDHDCHLYLRRAKFCELLLDAPSDYVDAVVSLEMAHRHE